jgi:protein-disulfide isomerase
MSEILSKRLFFWIAGLCVLLWVWISFPRTAPQYSVPDQRKERVVAHVGSRSITLRDVEQAGALQLYQVEEQRTNVLRQTVQQLIDEELLRAEASRKGLTVDQLLEAASHMESITRLADLPGPVRQPGNGYIGTGAAASDPQHAARIRQALLVALRRHTDIRVDLPEPDLPILPVTADGNPWIGTPGAAVTIIEFSDFECPYCKLSQPVLKEILERYPGKVKLVYRDFPGPNHAHAQQAAEAAQCAAEQGRFWQYHDALFDRQVAGSGWDFSALAQATGIDLSAFEECRRSGRVRSEVSRDVRDGSAVGVMSTPTFFINGRPLVGARAFADFQALIEKILAQPTASDAHL